MGWYAMRSVAEHSRHKGHAKGVMYAIAFFAREGLAYPSLSTIADHAGISLRTAERAVAKCLASGELSKIGGRPGLANEYRINLPIDDNPRQSDGSCDLQTPVNVTATPVRMTMVADSNPRQSDAGPPSGCRATPVRMTTQPLGTSKEPLSARAPRAKTTTFPKEIVEDIYQAYPRKVGKQAALKAIAQAIKRIDATEEHANSSLWLLGRVEAFAKAVDGAVERRFIKHPATWMNKGCYDDDPNEWSAIGRSRDNGRTDEYRPTPEQVEENIRKGEEQARRWRRGLTC